MLVAVIHALLLTPLVMGGMKRKHLPMPDQMGAGASALVSTAQASEAMQLVDLANTASSDEPALEDIASLGIELPKAALVIVSPVALPAPVFEEDLREQGETTQAAGDSQGHAAMFGRYIGQISARVERAWVRPRSDIGAARFSCQAKIEQDRRGYVQSVELRNCNGDWRWQQSLVSAVEHASPLPSPPVSSVFTNKLVLDFSAAPYMAGISEQSQYEPEMPAVPAAAVMVNRVVAPAADMSSGQTVQDVQRNGGHIDLRIEGKTVTWTLRETEPTSSETANDEGAQPM